jgi:hypothetical protein
MSTGLSRSRRKFLRSTGIEGLVTRNVRDFQAAANVKVRVLTLRELLEELQQRAGRYIH